MSNEIGERSGRSDERPIEQYETTPEGAQPDGTSACQHGAPATPGVDAQRGRRGPRTGGRPLAVRGGRRRPRGTCRSQPPVVTTSAACSCPTNNGTAEDGLRCTWRGRSHASIPPYHTGLRGRQDTRRPEGRGTPEDDKNLGRRLS